MTIGLDAQVVVDGRCGAPAGEAVMGGVTRSSLLTPVAVAVIYCVPDAPARLHGRAPACDAGVITLPA